MFVLYRLVNTSEWGLWHVGWTFTASWSVINHQLKWKGKLMMVSDFCKTSNRWWSTIHQTWDHAVISVLKASTDLHLSHMMLIVVVADTKYQDSTINHLMWARARDQAAQILASGSVPKQSRQTRISALQQNKSCSLTELSLTFGCKIMM